MDKVIQKPLNIRFAEQEATFITCIMFNEDDIDDRKMEKPGRNSRAYNQYLYLYQLINTIYLCLAMYAFLISIMLCLILLPYSVLLWYFLSAIVHENTSFSVFLFPVLS